MHTQSSCQERARARRAPELGAVRSHDGRQVDEVEVGAAPLDDVGGAPRLLRAVRLALRVARAAAAEALLLRARRYALRQPRPAVGELLGGESIFDDEVAVQVEQVLLVLRQAGRRHVPAQPEAGARELGQHGAELGRRS